MKISNSRGKMSSKWPKLHCADNDTVRILTLLACYLLSNTVIQLEIKPIENGPKRTSEE
jgi:hypothetical protein